MGNMDQSQVFLRKFEGWWLVNSDKPVLADPFRRATLFLTFINGKDIDNWVNLQRAIIKNNLQKGRPSSSESHWKDLKKAFKEAFVDIGEKLSAHQQLDKLSMQGGDVDAYIVAFNRLIKVVRYTDTNLGTIIKFQQGLNPKLLSHLIMLP